MFRSILIAVDGSPPSMAAARHGIALAAALGARVTAVMVTTPWAVQLAREPAAIVPGAVVAESEYEDRVEAAAAKVLQSAADAAQAASVACKTLHVSHRDPFQGILDAAAKERCDLIVVGSHGRRGVAAVLLGNEARRVISHSTLPVLVYRGT